VLAAGHMVGAEPEDKEALGDSPTEEPTVLRGDIVGKSHHSDHGSGLVSYGLHC
jgi:hypothetical protein